MWKLMNLLRRNRVRMEQDLGRELRYHMDRRVEDLKNQGVSDTEARRLASIQFGGVAQVQEEVREMWLWRWLRDSERDVRYAARMLRRSPGFTATAVLSLALGIGANTAIFSILHALVLRSLPVHDPQRLVVITRGSNSFSYPLFDDFRQRSQTLQAIAFRTLTWRLSLGGVTERITGAVVSGNYFDVLGIRPAIGTAITEQDDTKPGSGGWRGPVVVISHRFWMQRLGGEKSVIGTHILLNGGSFTVVGVAPQWFEGTEVGESPDVFAPMMMQAVLWPGNPNALAQRRNNWIRILGRLNIGVDARQAEAELTTLLRQFNEEMFQTGEITDANRRRSLMEQRIALLPGNGGISRLRQQYARPLWVLMTVMGLVLLIACANVANLLLSRATARRREIAIRLGVGAARSRLISQLFTESLLLAVSGGVSGLLLARWLRDILMGYLPQGQSLSAPLDQTALWFTLILATGAALLFGLAPAFACTKVDLAPALKGEEMAAKPLRAFFRKSLVAVQMSLSFLLLIAAALFLRSLHNLLTVDTGFAHENILIASAGAPPDGYAQFYLRLLEELKRLPGVVSAGVADSPPLGTNTGWDIFVPGFVPKAPEPRDSPTVAFISPGYLATMSIPLLVGRDFDAHDVSSRNSVMIVNETFARYFFEGRNPVGQRAGTSAGVYNFEIIGVAKDTKYTGLREGATRTIYVPYRPMPGMSGVVAHLRTAGNPMALSSALRQKVRDLDRNAYVFNPHTVADDLDGSLLRERLVGTVTGLFGALALVLAAAGLYGLMAYGVLRRTREFGIRMAIGAQARSIVLLVLRDAMWLLVSGVAAGLAASWALGRVVASMLFDIQPMDPVSAVIAIVVLSGAAVIAALIPARRASRVDPTLALRSQ